MENDQNNDKPDDGVNLGDNIRVFYNDKAGLEYEIDDRTAVNVGFASHGEPRRTAYNPHNPHHQKRREYTVGLTLKF